MSSSDAFRRVSRTGVRVGRPTLVLHAGRVPSSDPVRVGFVVSKKVGNAVMRNRVKRRLRHLVRGQLGTAPAGVNVVVRALPRAATDPTELPHDLLAAWSRAMAKVSRMPAEL